MLSIDPVKLALYAFLALALGIAGTLGFRAIFDRGVASQVSVTKSVQKELDELKAELKAANAQATQKAQEAAQMARAIEDEQRRRIEETEALEASYEALAELGAADYDRKLRNALARRASDCREVSGPRMSEATSGDIDRASAFGLLSIDLASDIGALAKRADRINSQYSICYAAVRAGREISR